MAPAVRKPRCSIGPMLDTIVPETQNQANINNGSDSDESFYDNNSGTNDTTQIPSDDIGNENGDDEPHVTEDDANNRGRQLFIGGEWRVTVNKKRIPIINPANEETIGHIPTGIYQIASLLYYFMLCSPVDLFWFGFLSALQKEIFQQVSIKSHLFSIISCSACPLIYFGLGFCLRYKRFFAVPYALYRPSPFKIQSLGRVWGFKCSRSTTSWDLTRIASDSLVAGKDKREIWRPYCCFDTSFNQRLSSQVQEIVGRINGRFGGLTAVPIHHLDISLEFHASCALYAVTVLPGGFAQDEQK